MITDAIYRWVDQKQPDGPQWTSPYYAGYADYPLEIRFLLSSDKLEFEIGNGGLPQFLWNTCYHWRWILEDCEAGYKMIGATLPAEAVPEIRRLCEEYHGICREFILRCVSTGNFQIFDEWMAYATATFKSDKAAVFYSNGGIHELKHQWYLANETSIRKHLS